jgi:hypothetical protein
MKKETIPYARMDQIINFVKKVSGEKISIEEIGGRFGRSAFWNVLPSLQLLELAEYDRKSKTVKFTDLGRKFRSALITDDLKSASDVIRNSVDKAPALSFVKALLERKGSISILDIGRELAFKFNKKWDNILTYKAHGAACASILGFVGYGIYDPGILRKSEIKIEKTEITPPYTGFKKIVRIVDTVSTFGEVDIHLLSKKLGTKKGRLSQEIRNCIDLGFLQRPAPGKVAITQQGRELVDPLNKNRISEIFRDALLSSKFGEIIGSLTQAFTVDDLGRILKHQIGGKWLESATVKTYGKKFYNWLNSAELLKEAGKEKYRVASEIVRERIKKPEKVRFLSSIDFYELGKSVGIILSPKNEFEKVKKAAKRLIELCRQEKSLSTMANILDEHYKLFLDLKDSRIFHADIRLIERALGVEEWNTESIR